MRTYLELAKGEFRRYSTYRMAIAAGVFTNSVFGFIRVGVLFAAIAAAGGTLAGYDRRRRPRTSGSDRRCSRRSRCTAGWRSPTGSRPGRSPSTWPGQSTCSSPGGPGPRAGRVPLLTRGLPPLLVGALTIGGPARVLDGVPARPAQPDARGLDQLHLAVPGQPDRLLGPGHPRLHRSLLVIVGPLSGFYVPVHMFPDWLRAMANASPVPVACSRPRSTCCRAGCRARTRWWWWPSRLAGSVLLVLLALRLWPGRADGWWCRVAEHGPVAGRESIGAGRLADPQPVAYRQLLAHGGDLVPHRAPRVHRDLRDPAQRADPRRADLVQAALVFALANIGFALADLVFGQLDAIPTYLRMGRLEALLVRPHAAAGAADHRRLPAAPAGPGRRSAGDLARRAGLDGSAGDPEAATCCSSPRWSAPPSTALCSCWPAGPVLPRRRAEFTNSFVYGGAYAGQVPGSVLLSPIRVLFTFVVPATITAYLPSLDNWACPAGVAAVVAGLVRAAVRRLGLAAGPAGLAGRASASSPEREAE